MAAKAYLLVETSVGKTREVATRLTGLAGITSVDVVTGPFDIIATINADDVSFIGDLVTGQIHTVDGVHRTVTCIAVGG